MIGVSLLCTQASPMLRPSMSRVVAMLLGDIEVSTVTSRPGYLTDWTYDDITNALTEGATIWTDTSYVNSSSTSTSMVVVVENSTAIESNPMLGEIISEGQWELFSIFLQILSKCVNWRTFCVLFNS